jgi:NTP pyrophosphatase (non-canonical NTP hydrolase)
MGYVGDAAGKLNGLRDLCHGDAKDVGWWDDVKTEQVGLNTTVPTKLCLIHSEISEAMEGFRKGAMDSHLTHRLMIEVELADAIIRILDLAGAMDLDIGGAFQEKLMYNKLREDHKRENRAKAGGKKF